jgi:hypothetical protein
LANVKAGQKMASPLEQPPEHVQKRQQEQMLHVHHRLSPLFRLATDATNFFLLQLVRTLHDVLQAFQSLQ